MLTRILPTLVLAGLSVAAAFAAPAPAPEPLMLVPDQVLVQDDFSTAKPLDRETWRIGQGTQWTVQDGVLRGQPSTPEFQASHKTHKGLEPRLGLAKCPPTYIVRFSIRYLGGNPTPNLPDRRVPSIDIGHHVGRLEFGTEGTRLLAEGETIQLAEAPDFKLEREKWYDVLVEARDGETVVQFAGGPTFYGAHPFYRDHDHTLAFVGNIGGKIEVDNLTLWSAKPDPKPTWVATAAKLPKPEAKTIRPKTPGQIAKEKAEEEAKGK